MGFDNLLGHLKGVLATWIAAGKETNTIVRITANEFYEKVKTNKNKIIDIRKETECRAEYVDVAYNKPLAYINTR